MKINHIIPRHDTKRAAALQLRANKILVKRLIELGGESAVLPQDSGDALRVDFDTDFGVLRLTVFKERHGSNTVAVFGRFETMDIPLVAAAAKVLNSNPYSGKWNHFAPLTYTGMENLLGTLTNALPRIIDVKKARAVSDPAY